MKKITIALCLMLAFSMIMSIPASAKDFYSGVLDNPNYQENIDGINYVEKTSMQTNYTQRIFYGEYNTTAADAKYEWVIHSIKSSETTTTLSTVMQIAKDFESTTGRKVMLAVNGDYFYATGSNVDAYVNNGIIRSKGTYAEKSCIGFDNNGKVAIGEITETVDCVVLYDANGNPIFYPIAGYNRAPKAGEITVYKTQGTYTVENAGATVIYTESANLNQYPIYAKDRTSTTKGVLESKEFTLKSGQIAVVYTETHSDVFSKIKYGTVVDIVETPAGDFEGCTWAVGGWTALVKNGVVNTTCHSDGTCESDAPRTFMGFKKDGTGFVCVLDGRQGATGGYGITVHQQAVLADVLDAEYALELDGGGSSTMIVRLDDTLTLRNSPSDGSMRKVSNAVLLVEKAEEDVEENPGNNDTTPDETPTVPGDDKNPGVEQGGVNQGNTSGGGGIIAFFRSIFEAIKKFFMNLFS